MQTQTNGADDHVKNALAKNNDALIIMQNSGVGRKLILYQVEKVRVKQSYAFA